MGAAGATLTGGAAASASSGARFHSAGEAREVLDRLLSEIDGDPAVGLRSQISSVPHRLQLTDLGLVLNVARAESGPHDLRWAFTDEIDWEPALALEMDSTVANRYLQGAENFGIALARGEIRVSCEGVGAALAFLPASVELIARYRRIVERDYPHLLIRRG
ncbi:MAG: hypothetical protein U0R52_14355 [Solirubrobacterales bacterium]